MFDQISRSSHWQATVAPTTTTTTAAHVCDLIAKCHGLRISVIAMVLTYDTHINRRQETDRAHHYRHFRFNDCTLKLKQLQQKGNDLTTGTQVT